MLFLTILAAIFCFAAAVLMLTPFFRKLKILLPLSCYLLFEGVWLLVSYPVLQVNPSNAVIFPINYIATVLILGYAVVELVMARAKARPKKQKQAPKPEEAQK